jgi:LuxR family maltose regulon positive regulatory protein
MTQARVWIADGTEASLVKAIELLQTLRQLAQTYWLTNQTIEIAVLQSLALEKQGHTKEALVALKEALDMAETGGWIRPFVELGAPMANMLTQLSEEKFSVDFWRKLVVAFDNEKNLPEDAQHMPPAAQTKIPPAISAKTLVDSLTNREMDVLELLIKRYQTKEIANKLSVSPETVKSHLKNIYQKLNVSDRRKAVKKARQLGVI